MKLPEDGTKYESKYVEMFKQEQLEQRDWFLLKYVC
jgi:hypothetical protein